MFELFDSAFERGGDCLAVTFDDAINERSHLILDIDKLTLEDRFAFSASRSLPLPHITEDSRGQVEQLTRGSQRAQQLNKRAFYLVASNGLAFADAARLTAEIVRVRPELTLGPVGGQSVAAVVAGDETAKREILVEVNPCRSPWLAEQTLLNPLKGLQIDDSLVLPFAPRDLPSRDFDIPGEDRLGQELPYALMQHDIVPCARKLRVRLEEAFHLPDGGEPPAGKAVKSFLYNSRERLRPNKHLAAVWSTSVCVAPRGLKHPISVQHSRVHPVKRLLAVLLALMLGHACEQVLHELAV